jgi:Kdo2-lipid IVA lauroyltransferase/acyltransferase
VLGDQAAGIKGCWVDFFGRPASAHKAVALFSLANNAPLAVGYARRRDKPLHYEMALGAIFDPRVAPAEQRGLVELSQWFTSHLEQFVREAPEQYWWVHRRWKGQPPARAKRRQAA